MKLYTRVRTKRPAGRKPSVVAPRVLPKGRRREGLRILLTTDTIGSVWTFTRELTEQYVRRGHSVVVMGIGPAATETQRAWCEEVRRAYPDQFFFEPCTSPLEWMDDNERAYIAPAPTLLDLVRRFEPHVLHTSQYCFGALPTLVPRIVTAHHDLMSWAQACKPGGLEPAPWLDRYLVMVQRGLDNADAVVAPTEWMLGQLLGNFRAPASRHVIAHGRTLDEADVRPGKSARKVQAVTVGRMWEQVRNLALLTEARSPMPIFVARRRRYDAPALVERRSDLRVTGPLSEIELLALFAGSSVYVAPSAYDPFNLAALEAALCGCAVVANDLGANHEMWGDAALYFSSAAELEAILTRLNEDPAALLEQQQRSRTRALAHTAAAMAESYLALYERLSAQSVGQLAEPNLSAAG